MTKFDVSCKITFTILALGRTTCMEGRTMKTHFLTLLLAVFLAFSLTPSAKAEEAPDVQPEQFETLDAVESGETDETTDPVEAERYFVGRWWTYGGDLGIIDGGDERAAEGEEVFFYATPEEGYVCSLIKVSNGYVGENGAVYAFDDSELAFTDHGDGTYSFIMPGNPVQVYVAFGYGQEYNWDDPEGYFAGRVCDSRGSIEFLKDAMYYEEGEEVFFYITTEDDVTINEIVVENSRELEDGSVEPIENSFVEFTAHEDGTYSFIMPGNPVQIYVDFSDGQEHNWDESDSYFVCRAWTTGGKPEFVNAEQENAKEGEEVFFYVDLKEGFTIENIWVSNALFEEDGCFVTIEDSYLDVTAHEDGTYSFIMPGNPVQIFVETSGEGGLPDGYFVGNSVQFGELEFVNDIDWFATEGTEVIFRINTYEGHALDRVEIVNCTENEEGILEAIEGSFTEVTLNEDGTYSFIMPANPVIVYAAFDGGQEWYEDEGYFVCRSWTNGGTLEFLDEEQSYAEAGEEVFFSVTVDDGFTLGFIRVSNGFLDENGYLSPIEDSELEVIEHADGTYSFIMPDNPVYVYVEFFGEGYGLPDGYFVGNCVEFGEFEFVNDIDWFATEGTEVIFRINAYEGYVLDRAEVLNCIVTEDGIIEPVEGSLTEVTENADGTYSFVMPANPVIINAVMYEAPIGNFIGRCPQEGGNLEFVNDDQWFATEGETVSFRAVADQGYELDRVEVMNCRDLEDGSIEAIDGSYVTVTKNADGTYTFVMPDNGVQVFAFFKEKVTAPICNPTWPTFGFGWNWGWNSMNHLFGMVQNAWNAFSNCYRYPAHMGWMGRNCGWGFFF